MNKKILFGWLICSVMTSCTEELSEDMEPISEETNAPVTILNADVYIPGTYNRHIPLYFKNNEAVALTSKGRASADFIAVNNEDVYVLGTSSGSDNKQEIVYWKNNVEQTLKHEKLKESSVLTPVGISTSNNDVHIVLRELNTSLYGDIFYFKNDVEQRISAVDKNAHAKDMLVVNEDVYIVGSEDNRTGGFFNDPDDPPVAKYWKNGEGKVLRSNKEKSNEITHVVNEGNDIYMAVKELGTACTSHHIYKNDQLIKSFPLNEEINDFVVVNGDFYVVTSYVEAMPNMVKIKLKYYKNDEMKELNSPLTNNITINVDNEDVFISGVYFNDAEKKQSGIIKNEEYKELSFEGQKTNLEISKMIIN